ncbi:MAG: FAD-dependent oxidoreductase, partial [Acidimicrobiales bacterium]|nr:FAD-dependent oxidoreductase [Acidimicrobiales bacterium]
MQYLRADQFCQVLLAYRDDVGPAAAISRIAYMNPASSITFGLVTSDAKFEVIVVGAGIIGLSIAYELVAEGLKVALVDPTPGERTSHVGAGMIAPVSETAFGEDDLTQFNLLAASSWPNFQERLKADSNCDLEFVHSGTIAVAFNADDRRFLMDLLNYQLDLGLEASPLTNGQCLELEPTLNPRVAGGILAKDDCHVNPRKCVDALLLSLNHLGAT